MLRNRLLNACPAEELQQFASWLDEVPLTRGRSIYQSRFPIEFVYFVEEGLIATCPEGEDQASAGAWIVGREGCVCGIPLLLGSGSSPHRRTVLAPGSALVLNRAVFTEAVQDLPNFRALLLAYAHQILIETTQICMCNARHSAQQRFARILLTAADRLGAPAVPLTHSFGAQLLGGRRATVTETLQCWRKQGLVDVGRSMIRLRDRERLRGVACPCYEAIARLDQGSAPAAAGEAELAADGVRSNTSGIPMA